MTAMELFHDIPVVPATRVTGQKGNGGPAWPEFERQVAVRFCRDGIPCDEPPEVPPQLGRVVEPAVWGGFLVPQFGHLTSEGITRLPQSLAERPDDLYLFTRHPGQTPDAMPGFIWEVLDWLGVPRDRIRLVTEACEVRDLRVAPQGEMLGKVPTPPAYLARLDAIAARRLASARPAGLVFVTRAGLVARGQGGHAGEGYLAHVLAQAGVRVIDPGQMPLTEQMSAYAGAEVLVFSEGSALHGRCLLGWLPQDIHVLRRRSRRDTARVQLQARCRRLTYVEALSASLGAARRGMERRPHLTAALFDLDQVFRLFAALGIDLAPHWDNEAYLEAVRLDLAGWTDRVRTSAEQQALNLKTLAAFGMIPGAMPAPPLRQT